MLVKTSHLVSLVDLLQHRADAQGAARAYTFLECGETEGPPVTWARLDEQSRAIAVALAERLPRGARVLLLFPPGLDFIGAFFGTLYAGTIAVPAYLPAGVRMDPAVERLRGMAADAGIAMVLTTGAVTSTAASLRASVPELGGVPWLDVTEVVDERAERWTHPAVNSEDLALLQYTSGSTAAPRGVMISHGNLLHNLACSARLARHTRDSVSVSWLPVSHEMGLIGGILQPLYSGFPTWLMSPISFLQRPARWLQAISRFAATHSGGPNFAYDLCVRHVADHERETLDLQSWTVAFNGSEPIRSDTLAAFERRFAPCGFRWDAFRPAYGLAESTLLVATSVPGEEPTLLDVPNTIVSFGNAFTCRIDIVDPERLVRCLPGQTGEIWLSGPSVARGYWRRPNETAATFQCCLADGEGPFLRTGDLGFLQHGHLFVSGRIKDLLIVRGLKQDASLERTA